MATIEELSEEFNLPEEVIEDYAYNVGVEIQEINEIPFVGKYRSERDFAIEQVEEGMVSNLSYYLTMSNYDMEQVASEEADSRLDNIDEDEIIEQAGFYDNVHGEESDESEIHDMLQIIDIAENDIEILNDRYIDENITEGERDDIELEIKKLQSIVKKNEHEIEEIKNNNTDRMSYEEAVKEGREKLYDEYYDDIYSELRSDAVSYFTDNLGYTEESLVKNSNFSLDYDGIARDLSDSYTFIDYNGDVYVFHNSYADGGTLGAGSFAKGGNIPSIEKRVAEVNALIKEGNDKGLSVVDETNTWQAPMKYSLLKYSNGVLYAEYKQLNLYMNNKGRGSYWGIKKIKITKRDTDYGYSENMDGYAQRLFMSDISRMYRKALNHFIKYGFADGGYMADGGGIKGGGFDQNGNPYGFDDEMDSVYEWHYNEGDKVYRIWDKIDGVYVAELPSRIRAIEWIERNKYSSMADGGYMAEGGMIEHGLKTGDKIVSGKIIGTTIKVRNENFDEDAIVDLNTGKRTIISYNKNTKKWEGKMADGGSIAKGGKASIFAKGGDIESYKNDLTKKVNEGDTVSTKEYASLYGISTPKAYQILSKLEELGLVCKYGYKTRSGWEDIDESNLKPNSLHWQVNRKYDKGGDIVKDIKVPNEIILKVSTEKIKQQNLPTLEVIGGIKLVDYAKKASIPPLINDDYKMRIKGGNLVMELTPKGKMSIKVKSRSIKGYLAEITKVANDTFSDYIKSRFADGGVVENKIDELYKKSNFINDDFNWKSKLLEMLQDGSIEAYNIYQSLTQTQKEAVLQELFEMDNDMGSEGDGEIETSRENLDILLEDAKGGRRYADGGSMSNKKKTTFDDKVSAIKKSLQETEVPKKYQKEYGKTYDKKESLEAAKKIAGAMRNKYKMKKGGDIKTVENIDIVDFDADGDMNIDAA